MASEIGTEQGRNGCLLPLGRYLPRFSSKAVVPKGAQRIHSLEPEASVEEASPYKEGEVLEGNPLVTKALSEYPATASTRVLKLRIRTRFPAATRHALAALSE
jgi:hypothetical protein